MEALLNPLTNYEAAVKEGRIPAVSQARGAFDLKGVMSSLTVLRIRTTDLSHIERQLRLKVTQFPQFFEGAPVVIDMGGLDGSAAGLPLGSLAHLLRACKVVPAGIINLADEHRAEAIGAGLGILSATLGRQRDGDKPAEEPPAPEVQVAVASPVPVMIEPDRTPVLRPPMVIRTPVRSGQVIYAQHTDLIVLGPVNPGAQLVADGNIHVYAPLRGRALAGARGYTEARIFCQRLEAELLSIAGAYVMADDIPEDRWGRAVQVHVENGECRLQAL